MEQKSNSDPHQVAQTKLNFKWSDRDDPRWKELIEKLGMDWDGKFVHFHSHTVESGFDIEMVMAVGKHIFDVDFQANYYDILRFCKLVWEVWNEYHQ